MAFDGTTPTRALADAVALYEAGDFRAALPAFRALAEGGDDASRIAAAFYLGRMASRGEAQARDLRAAVRWYRQAAAGGDYRAMHNLALALDAGHGVPRDPAEATTWLRRAAEAGSGRSQAMLGYRLATGTGIDRDLVQAVAWFRRGAEQGEAEAMVGLGDALRAGAGVERDLDAALRWYGLAAERGHAGGCYAVGDMHAEGLGVKRDLVEAARWFARAAAQGHVWAQHAMGHACLNAHGVRQDFAAAFGWFRRAADQGFAPAQHSLAFMLLAGEGVPADANAARAWMRLAADQDHPRAQHLLGMMCRDGLGGPADPVEAWRWFELAAAAAARRGDDALRADAVEARDAVAGILLPDQRADAEARARAWKPRGQEQSANRAMIAAARAWELADAAQAAGRGRAPDDPEPAPFGDSVIFRQDPAGAAARVAEARRLTTGEAHDPQAALRLLDEAMRLDYQGVLDADDSPLLPRLALLRAAGQDEPERALKLYDIGVHLAQLERWSEASAVYRAAGDLDPLFAWPFNNLAWMLATATQVRAHDGPLAVTYAVRACDMAGWRYWPFLGTLAAAFARSGDFDRAAAWQALALALSPPEEQENGRAMLDAFEAGQAWTDTGREPAAGGANASEADLSATDVEALLEAARGLIEGKRVVQ